MKLADAIRDVKTRIRHCSICYNLTEAGPVRYLRRPVARSGLVCVVEQPKDLLALESAGLYQGVYHVLLGRISPLEDIEPGDLTIEPLIAPARPRRHPRGHHGNQPQHGRRRHRALHPEPDRRAISRTCSSPAWPAGCRPAATSNTPTGTSSPMRSAGAEDVGAAPKSGSVILRAAR